MRIVLLALFVPLALLLPARPSLAQTSAARFSFTFEDQPLRHALDVLIHEVRLEVAYDPQLVEGKRTHCVVQDAVAEEVLRCVLHDTGLGFARLSSGIYVLAAEEEEPLQPGHLSGAVLDEESGEPLPSAHVRIIGTEHGTATNSNGRFVFPELPPGTYRLTVSYVGYETTEDSVRIAPGNHAHTDIQLTARPVLVAPVVIDGLQWQLPSSRLGAASTTLNQHIETAALTSSVSQELSSLMGVQLHDATSEIHVQGGRSGDHQFRLDGVPLFLPTNLGGFIGPFSPFAVGHLTVHKAGYGAPEGSQLSGVIDVDHALGGPDPYSVDLQVDAMSANGRVRLHSNPDRNVQATAMTAVRYGLWGIYTAPSVLALLEDWNRTDPLLFAAFGLPDLAPSESTGVFTERIFSTGNPSLGFLDLHGATRIRFGPLHSLYASGYWGERQLDSDRNPFAPTTTDPTQRFFRDFYTWETTAGQVRYESVLNARTMASLQLRASHYALQHDYGSSMATPAGVPSTDDQNHIDEFGGVLRLRYVDEERFNLDVGLEPAFTRSRFVIQGTHALPINHDASDWRVATFVENSITPSPNVILELGARFTFLPSHRRVFAEPRLALRYDQPDSDLGPWALRVGLGLYRQYVSQFDVSSRSPRALLSSNRVWLVVDSTVSPQRASHFSTEFIMQPTPSWTIRFEGYLKHLLHLLAVTYTAEPHQDQTLQGSARFPQNTFLRNGSGYAHGAALQIEKQIDRVHLETRYEYSFSERSLETLFRGAFDPVPWSKPHQLVLAADWIPSQRIALLARWRSIWGRSWGFRQAYYDFFGANETPAPIIPNAVLAQIQRHVAAYNLDNPREHRLPALHQLDLSAAFTQPFGATSLQVRLDLLNVLGRENIADWRFTPTRRYDNQQLLARGNRLLLPFTPALAIRVSR